MSVLRCDRYGCENILCNRLSNQFGYLCNDCFTELVESAQNIENFMESKKEFDEIPITSRRDILEAIFEIT